MRKIIPIVQIVLILILVPLSVFADDAPSYSFATAQGDVNFDCVPGDSNNGYIYFYNVDGNRITHIAMESIEVPEGWTVEFDPPLADRDYDLGGDILTISENLFAEPTEIFAEPIASPPAGTISLTLPKKLGGADTPDDTSDDVPGYCVAKELKVVVSIPEDVPKNISEWIRVKATASWVGQTGAADIVQTRDFNFRVTTVYELIDPTPVTPFDWNRWLPVIIAGGIGVAVVGVIYIPKLIAKRRSSA